MITKVCCRCNKELPIDNFNKNRNIKDGRHSSCRKCRREYEMNRPNKKEKAHAWYVKNAQKMADQSIKRLYGLTREEYDNMRIKQGFKCAICNRHETEFSKSLHVDHCHDTGKIRGLLCARCNLGVGQFENSPKLLYKVIKYLGDQCLAPKAT